MSEFKTAAAGETEAQFRQFLSYLFQQASRGTAVTGVLGGDGLSVSQTATPSGSVQIIAGAAVQQTSLTTGVSPLISNATKTVDVLGASPMGALPRNDLIVFDASTATIVAVIGTPNASPTDPTPANPHVKLARLRNPASATTIVNANIDDLRVPVTLAPSAQDSGWVNIAIAGGKAGQAGAPPQVRKEGKRVSARWGWDNTGLTTPGGAIVAGTVPDGYRPVRTTYINMVGSTGNQRAMAVIDPSTGQVTIRIGSAALDYYLFPGELGGWWTD